MRLVEIAGHLIDPGKVSYVGPIGNTGGTSVDCPWFTIVIGTAKLRWRFVRPKDARNARRDLAAAIESAQPEMTEIGDAPVISSTRAKWLKEHAGVDVLKNRAPFDALVGSDMLLGIKP